MYPTSHVTRTLLSRSKGQGHQAALLIAALSVRQVQRWLWERIGRWNYCYVASARRRARRWGGHGGSRGAGAYRVATACSLRPTVKLVRYIRCFIPLLVSRWKRYIKPLETFHVTSLNINLQRNNYTIRVNTATGKYSKILLNTSFQVFK